VDQKGDISKERSRSVQLMPARYRILFWIVYIDLISITLWVWWMAFKVIPVVRSDIFFPLDQFRHLVTGYHAMLLAITFTGWAMQATWYRMGILSLFVPAIIAGTLWLNMAAFKLWVLLSFF